jgi:hypothetical protein
MAYDPSVYEAQRRQLMQNYAAEGSMNAFARTLSQQRGERSLADMSRSYEKAAPQVVSGYGRRGMLSPNIRSGAFARAMREFATERIRSQSQAAQDLALELGQQDVQERMRQERFNQTLQDLEADKARQIAQDAQAILQYRAGV